MVRGEAFEGLPLDFLLVGETGRLKAVHYVKISRGPAFYLTEGLFVEGAQKDMKEGWNMLLRFFHSILTVHVDADGGRVGQNSKDAVTRLEKEIAEALATLELTMPAIFFHTQAHILLHVPQAVLRWGSVRNFWAFSMERSVQHMNLALFLPRILLSLGMMLILQ